MAPSITSVTGTLTHGQSLTISGSGFGTKSTAAPMLWDTFESGTPGQNVDGNAPIVGSAWGWYSTNNVHPVYSSSHARSASASICSYHNHHTVNVSTVALDQSLTASQYFISFWRYYDPEGGYSRNVKPFTLYGSSSDQPLAYVGWGNPDESDGDFRTGCIDNSASTDTTLWGSHPLSETIDAWVRYDIWLVQSTPNTQDGRFQVWSHRPGVEVVQLQMSDTSYRTRTTSNYWHQLHLGSYNSYDPPTTHTAHVYIDDVYVDSTTQRIEIGDASTWSACTHREVQRPTSWADGVAICTLNVGSIADISTAYLYVVDSDNVASSGFAMSDVQDIRYVWGVRSA